MGRIIIEQWNQPNDTISQMEKTNGNAILMIRNPFHAILGLLNHRAGGHLGQANLSLLIGSGNVSYIN